MKILFILFFMVINYSVFADNLFNTTIQNGCAAVYDNKMRFETVFVPTVYNCSAGYYLPANAISCSECPDGFSCAGGAYEFNENLAQGIVFNNAFNSDIDDACSTNIRFFEPEWTPNQYTCSAGYYLPANADSCAQCPENSYCGGGTYTFSETTDQGATACPSTHPTSAAGSSSINQCKKQINWYNEGSLSTSTTCNYDGLINLPPAPAPRTGYIFNGWKLENK